MKDFTAELEHVFGAAPSGQTGLLIDTFDGAGVGGDVRWTQTRAEVAGSICLARFCTTRATICGTRAAVVA
ncbi:hypothetical protein [Lentzea aerocolonigenes]|uniref:hypothetical protein n=1 Tax=Lentzea aerocolonigenes TaxID=68170 RepID=UPI0004C41F3B|nr:hypothetical protein [Lentzea aerocolonigenes]MCP2245399.1 hypothetical protein [Lentzea aerocolonigenes]